MSIGEKIKELRKSKNKSQEDLAFELGVSRQTINKWETDKAQPHSENIKSLCAIFGVSADFLLDSETVTNDESNKDTESISTEVANKNGKAKRIALIICSALDGLLFIPTVIMTILFAFVAFSTNRGFDYAGTDNKGMLDFIVMLILSLLFLVIGVLLLLTVLKNRQNKTKKDTKEKLKQLNNE